jgi:hypothetical protein
MFPLNLLFNEPSLFSGWKWWNWPWSMATSLRLGGNGSENGAMVKCQKRTRSRGMWRNWGKWKVSKTKYDYFYKYFLPESSLLFSSGVSNNRISCFELICTQKGQQIMVLYHIVRNWSNALHCIAYCSCWLPVLYHIVRNWSKFARAPH